MNDIKIDIGLKQREIVDFMESFSTDALLLKRTEYGDYDLIITYFTHLIGKLSVIAKNAKKSARRFAGALDPFIAMNIECSFPKKRGLLPVLNSVDIQNPFSNIRTSTIKTGYASYWIEMINSWTEEGKQDASIYELILNVLNSLNTGIIPVEVLSVLFQIKFMGISGFTPNLINCGECGISIDDIRQNKILFDMGLGKIICDSCYRVNIAKNSLTSIHETTSNYKPVSQNFITNHNFNNSYLNRNNMTYRISVSKGTLKQLSWIGTTDIRHADRLKFSKTTLKEGEHLLEGFIPFHTGHNMKSLTFLKRIRE